MFSARQLAVTVVAVFAALGLGVLAGAAVFSSDNVVLQQSMAIDGLERDLARERQRALDLEAECVRLEDELLQHQALSNWALPQLVDGRLKGLPVAVITWGDGPDATPVLATLSRAGAEVRWAGSVAAGMSPSDVEQAEAMSREFGHADLQAGAVALSIEFARALAGKGDPALVDILKAMGLVTGDDAPKGKVRACVILPGQTGLAAGLDLAFARELLSAGVTVVAVEATRSLPAVPAYRHTGAATVDNVDTVAGQVAMVYALLGKGGHYGVKETAGELLPLAP